MSRCIELLLSRKETFPISLCSPGCMKAKKGLEEEGDLPHPGEGEEVQWRVCVSVCFCCRCRCVCVSAAVQVVIKMPSFITGIRHFSHSYLQGEMKLLPVVLFTAILIKKILGGGNLCG